MYDLILHGPIGVFDSGMGGLTVLKEIATLLPEQDFLYLGDTARVPYGTRSPTVIRRYVRENANFLMKQNIRALVVACNTATAIALNDLTVNLPIPVFGVIEPGARCAVEAAPHGIIAILATETTIESKAYEHAIHRFSDDATVIGQSCPLFVPLAEEGWVENEVAKRTADIYLRNIRDRHVDVVVLGCTHYPLLANTIAGVLTGDVRIIDSAHATANEVATALPQSPGTGCRKFFVTDAPERFSRIGSKFLGAPISDITCVDIC